MVTHDLPTLAAWCYTLPASKRQTLFINLFAYNLWSYLSILLLVVFFMVTLCYTCRVVSLQCHILLACQ